jgi:hypothetical protein
LYGYPDRRYDKAEELLGGLVENKETLTAQHVAGVLAHAY